MEVTLGALHLITGNYVTGLLRVGLMAAIDFIRYVIVFLNGISEYRNIW